MSLLITLDVFSGRPNPVWLMGDEAERGLRRRLEAARDLTSLRPSGSLGRLGYRGFLVQEPSDAGRGAVLRVHEGILDEGPRRPNRRVPDRGIEAFLLETAGEALPEEVRAHVEEALVPELADEVREHPEPYEVHRVGCPPCAAADAPSYDPARWNIAQVQPHNNCYNYANDQITNTFAQPGRATGALYTSPTCSAVESAARSDELRPHGNFSDRLAPAQGWYVALVLWPGLDYHWYRQDDVGCWSHKTGSTPVRDIDESGNQIEDPRNADRGPYTVFCSYMMTTRQVRTQ